MSQEPADDDRPAGTPVPGEGEGDAPASGLLASDGAASDGAASDVSAFDVAASGLLASDSSASPADAPMAAPRRLADLGPLPRGGLLPALGLLRPVSVGMICSAILLIGFLAWRSIPLELLPAGFTPPFLFVEVPTLRSSAEDVEQRIALPAEDLFSTLRNLRRLGTRIDANSARFIMEFADGTDMDITYDQVRDRLDRLKPQLDGDIGRSFIWKYNPSDDPILFMAVTIDEGLGDPGALIEERVIPRVERIPGVSRVQLWGAPREVAVVQVDDRQAEAAGTNLYDLVSRLSRDNFAMSAGTVDDSGRSVPVRVSARYESVPAMRELPVGNGLRLGDIADVRVVDRAERAIYRVNQRPSIFLEIYRESTANTVETAERVRAAFDGPLREDPDLEGLDYHFFFDQGEVIRGALGNLRESALWGAFFAVIVLLYFLRHLRMTAVITLAIPASLLATLVLMYFLGRSLNVLSLTGLMLAVGMVVDNSIVVVESIQRALADGRSPRDAALRGAADVALAIGVATSTTVVVFLPLILMSGSETLSFYLSQIGLPVCLALISSLVVSLVLLPLVTSRVLRTGEVREVRLVTWLEGVYTRALAWTLRHRVDAALIALAACVSVVIPAGHVANTDRSQPNIGDFRIWLNVPDNFTWEQRVQTLLQVEQVLWDHRDELEVENLLARIGGPWGRPQVRAFLRPPEERARTRDQVLERAQELLPDIPGMRPSLSWDDGGGATGAITLSVHGADSRVLADVADEVARRVEFLDGVTSVQLDAREQGQPEMQLVVDRERARLVGLDAFLVGATVDFTLRGRDLPELVTPSGKLPVHIEGDLAASDELDELSRLRLPSTAGDILLGNIASWTRAPGFRAIDREDRRTVLSLSIHTDRDDLSELRAEIDRVLADFEWPRGYGLNYGRRFAALEEGNADRVFALLLAIIFVFLLMGILFESFVLPFSILLSVPLAFVGVYWTLWLTDTSLDTMAGVGLILLVGIVVNNGIVLIDLVAELRRGGRTRAEALVEAGRQRLRPILMTAATTIFGLVPMAIGTSSLVGIPYAPLGRAVIGGLLASTALTLFVVPLFYTLLDDLAVGGTRLANQALRRPKPETDP